NRAGQKICTILELVERSQGHLMLLPLRPLDRIEDRVELHALSLRPLDKLEDRVELHALSLRPLDKLEDREFFIHSA
ncbi:MAG: hypothetical protein RR258_00840, partial [Alistipes sp.]